ncbi:MAG TPA: response regulator [Rhodospirillales bacterium]|nr:response regulator [Rhodospirillales bacterium]
MTEKVLIIDDDTNLLSGIQRQFRNKFDISVAEGGEKALDMVRSEGPFAVVICDMRMPGMHGVEVLGSLKEHAPDTVRMMLTGNADQLTAIEAINEGNIFRFFTKPCPSDVLAKGIEAGLEQYRLVTAEKELLRKTLAGSVMVLTDVLSMIDTDIFGKSTRLRDWARLLAGHLKLPQPWILDLSVMLSRIGWVAIPAEVREKFKSGESLSKKENEMIQRIPETGKKWISHIPRLEPVAEIVFYQNKGFDGSGFPDDEIAGKDIPLESRVLKVLNDLAGISQDTAPTKLDFRQLDLQAQLYDPEIVQIVRQSLPKADAENRDLYFETAEVPLNLLIAGYELLSDIETKDGKLILAKHQQLTKTLLTKLRNIGEIQGIKEPIRVRKHIVRKV